jgi:two-component system, chemotaxis family, chemotaxis protein CheY
MDSSSPNNKADDTRMFEVIEGLLDLCVEREKEIARLASRVEELELEKQHRDVVPLNRQKITSVLTGKQTIMVVDKSDYQRTQLVNLLKGHGYEVISEANSGPRAVEKYRDELPSIVTMDLDFLGAEGLEATKQIKQINPDVNVIVISGEMDRSMVLEAVSAGALEFLVKPVKIDRLLQILKRITTPGAGTPGETAAVL